MYNLKTYHVLKLCFFLINTRILEPFLCKHAKLQCNICSCKALTLISLHNFTVLREYISLFSS